jgi:hypothetical protein
MRYPLLAAALACAGTAVLSPAAHAHGIAGARIFPATLTMDDPAVGDELSLPTFQYQPERGSASYDYGFEWDKTITKHLGFAFNDDYQVLHQTGSDTKGWDDPVFTLKCQVFENDTHEILASVGVQREFGGIGAVNHGLADATGWTQPTLYVGKGFGDLPESWGMLRAFAVTGELGYQLSDTAASPDAVNADVSLQYPLQYLETQVKDYGLPAVVENMIPVVECAWSTPTGAGAAGATTTGTIAPGVLYESDTYQLGLEALIPATRASGSRVGVIAQFHLYLDDVLPNSLGKPIF